MAHDPYSPCVCGSGKKLKFCCQDILADMIRIEKLIDNQPDAAEKLLRSLLTQHTDKEVLVTQLASILTRKGQHQEAREQLVRFLQQHPDEPRVLLALADVCLSIDGFAASRRLVHRAFQLGARRFPGGVAMLASRIAGQMAQFGRAMAVREHLALAVRMAPADRRSALLMQLANFESQRTIPFPFRGRFGLLPVELNDEELQNEELRARKVSQIGCWEPAAILYSRLIEKQPDSAELWHNLGMCRAWDGQISEAAEAMHKAADLMSDFDSAAEAEALAQLLDLETTSDTYSIVQRSIPVTSVSELLTKLEAEPRIADARSSEEQPRGLRIVGEFELLTEAMSDDVDADDLPEVLADITVIDADHDDEDGPRVLVVALDADIEAATELFQQFADGHLTSAPLESPTTISRMPRECRMFDWKIHHPVSLGSSTIRELDQQRLQDALQTWLTTPQTQLGGASPMDAAKDMTNHVKVAGSLIVLDVTCNRMGYDPDLSPLRDKLGLPEAKPLETTEQQSITSLPLMQFSRLDPTRLTDSQVVEFTNRVTLVRHLWLLERATAELLNRPAAMEEFSPMRAYLLRANVLRERNLLPQASECFAAAREAVGDQQDAFRTRLELDIRELSCRLDNPQDPELPRLLGAIRDRYFLKIPEIEEVIRGELADNGCTHLLDQLEPATAGSGGGLWTPGADKPAGGTGKLYIPGQD
ncbi:MAG: tetratricopeptide repeat protein [Planctomycetaceae bacterium]